MKLALKIIQWIVAATFGICTLANGFHFSTLFLVLATILFLPIPTIRNFFKKKIKIKSWLAIVLALVLFVVGTSLSPITNPELNSTDTSSISSTIDDNVSSEDASSKTNLSNQESTSSNSTSSKETNNSTNSETSKPSTNIVGSGIATTIDPSSIPAYSGKPYVVINNNVPNFSASELTTKGYEKYSNLDNLGRTRVAIASVGKDTMPSANEERGNISSIKPTGWQQAQYDCVSGGWLYNRCHLIGWQLSAENANKSNLITGTKYLNINGMLPFENMVADYIKETNNHVAYRITPIYIGNNLLASGVQMEAYSIEDDGDGIMFNVYCYNVQPDITINYTTGSSKETNSNTTSSSTPTIITPEQETNNSTGSSNLVWIPNSGSKYHSRSGCSNMKNPTQVSKSEAENRGYEPCKKCW